MKSMAEFQRFTRKNLMLNALLISVFVMWTIIIGTMRQDQIILILLYLTCFYAHEKSRKFIIGFSIFIVYWIIYDSMRALPNYEVSAVNIREPYEIEKSLFGITINGIILTPNEYFAIHTREWLDVLSGLFYINWVPIPLAFGVYLFLKDKVLFTEFSLVFLFVNLMGFMIYYLYPAAPPWYVDLYGFDLQIGVPGNRAGLSRFDEIVGAPIFQSIYNKNANVLAAMPSLHATYPLIVLYYGIKKRLGWINVFFVIFTLGIWFAAVYSNHHYFVDVLVGILLTLFVFIISSILLKKPSINHLINRFVRYI